MTRSTLLILALLLGCTTDGGDLPPPPAQDLCNEGETSFFSCAITDTGESFSLCGQATEQMRPEDMWVQFRKSSSGSIEFVYPAAKKDSLRHFTAVNAAHATMDEDWIRFSDEKMQYALVNYMGIDGKIDSRVMSENERGSYKVQFCKSPTHLQWSRFKLLGEDFLEQESGH